MFEFSVNVRIGVCEGFILWYWGMFGMLFGNCVCVVLIVVCILCVVLFMLWFSVNVSFIWVEFCVLVELILVNLGIVLSVCFSGVVMLVVIDLGLVLGRLVLILMVG